MLYAMGHDLLFYDQCSACCQIGTCLTYCRVYTLDLYSFHFHVAALFHVHDGLWIQDSLSLTVTTSVMLLHIAQLRILSNEKGMNTIMFTGCITTVMNTASGNDRHITVFSDMEIIIYQFF